jgi:transposase-like protein
MRLTDEQKTAIVDLLTEGELSAVDIAKKLKVKATSVYYVKKTLSDPVEREDEPDTEEESEEEVEAEESTEYWKTWCGFWKEKYLETHSELVELQAVQE